MNKNSDASVSPALAEVQSIPQIMLVTVKRLAKTMIRGVVVMTLAMILAIGLLEIAQGAFEVWAYYYLIKRPHAYPVNTDTVFLGLKLLILYLVVIWVLTQYRSQVINQTIVKRSAKWGFVIGVLLIGLIALDRWVIHYYNKQIDCHLPGPMQRPYCKPNVVH